MNEQMSRTARLIGEQAVEKLMRSRVLLFGVGGVGSYVAEAIARAGVGEIDLVDGDVVALSNLNRQLVALHSTLGQSKAEVMARRIRDINPLCKVSAHTLFYGPENPDVFDFSRYDYVIDAIDSVASKLLIAEKCRDAGVRLLSSMGTGNKLDPSRFQIADISQTSVCPLARVMRRELRKRGIEHLKVLYSQEPPHAPTVDEQGQHTPASISFVPSAAGLLIAGTVVLELSGS